MKQPARPRKILVLVTSVGLVGALVAYRVVGARSVEPEPGSKAPPAAVAPDPKVFLGGSKSAVAVPMPSEGSQGSDDEYRMRGSKSLVPVFGPKDAEPPENPTENPPEKKTSPP